MHHPHHDAVVTLMRRVAAEIVLPRFRNLAADEIEESPGLKSRLDDAVERAYRRARLEASGETGLALRTFPETCPYSLDEIMNRPFAIDPDA